MKINTICEKLCMLPIVPGGDFFLGQDSKIKTAVSSRPFKGAVGIYRVSHCCRASVIKIST